jgi:hypothetical protein
MAGGISPAFNNPPLFGSIDDASNPNTGGVSGQGGQNPGVVGSSVHADGVSGVTEASDRHGVVGRDPSGNAFGALGGSDPIFHQRAGVFGQSDQTGVFGNSDADTGTGLMGRSAGAHGFGVRGETIAGIALQGQSFGGGLAGKFIGDVEVTGNLNMSSATSDIVLGDVAEGFSPQEGENIEPGTVVVLNGEGQIRAGDEAYDKRVAGVVSGAGNYRPAIVLDRQRTQASRLPVALMGKVCCKVDAQYSPIEVGDLLTTSPTPGHAMKAGDPLRAFGSVIGKALHPLKTGQGIIPVLIALQ